MKGGFIEIMVNVWSYLRTRPYNDRFFLKSIKFPARGWRAILALTHNIDKMNM
jgi:hypothetical protein